MMTYKTPAQIDRLREAGHLLTEVLSVVISAVHPGVTTAELNKLAESRIRAVGAVPSFLGYRTSGKGPRFPAALCASVNDQVVHAPPSARVLKEGDIIGLDLGLAVDDRGQWLYVDMAKTVPVGRCSRAVERLLRVTEAALVSGIACVAPGKLIADISRAIQQRVEAEGLAVVRQLVGHGVGFAVHEEPRVPNYVEPREPLVVLKPGLVLAIEPMVNTGRADVNILPDGWTVVTADGSLSAHFEHTVAVTLDGHEVLTQLPHVR